ncbi:hypothetical protein [Streptomyces chartreusis]|uniref:hypothetical protein n=1 Tax=Streptomyces chartreusis TaxID=1969 RepID=UPI002E196216
MTRFADQLSSLFRAETDGIIAALEEAISQGAKEEGPSESFTLPMNSFERRQLAELKTANDKQLRAMDHEAAAQLFALIPDITLGLQGWAASPVIHSQIGGTLLSTAARLHASGLNYAANEHSYRANFIHSSAATGAGPTNGCTRRIRNADGGHDKLPIGGHLPPH